MTACEAHHGKPWLTLTGWCTRVEWQINVQCALDPASLNTPGTIGQHYCTRVEWQIHRQCASDPASLNTPGSIGQRSIHLRADCERQTPLKRATITGPGRVSAE